MTGSRLTPRLKVNTTSGNISGEKLFNTGNASLLPLVRNGSRTKGSSNEEKKSITGNSGYTGESCGYVERNSSKQQVLLNS